MSSRLKPLTARQVQQAPASVFVGGAPGLQLLVSPAGTKSWRLFYRLPGASKRRSMSLGRFPGVSLADARRRALAALAEASAGNDPKAHLQETASVRDLSITALAEDYLAWCTTANAPKTVESKSSAFRVHVLPAWGGLGASDLESPAIAKYLDSLSDRPVMRYSLYLYLSHFFNWCLERGYVTANPLHAIKTPKKARARERVLTDAEIAALWQAPGTMASIARLSLLTAQRRGSVEAMRWQDIDAARAIWTVPGPNMKSSRVHDVPLSNLAMGELTKLNRMAGPYVFGVGSQGEKPYGGASNGMEHLRRQLGSPDWRLHDLRRTAVTLAQRGGCAIEEIRALSQHKVPGLIGVYARHAYTDEKRRVAGVIASEIGRCLDS